MPVHWGSHAHVNLQLLIMPCPSRPQGVQHGGLEAQGRRSSAGAPAPALRPLSRQASHSVAGKIAAFASGVAPVQANTCVEEERFTPEELMHKLESACRVRGARVCVRVYARTRACVCDSCDVITRGTKLLGGRVVV